MLSGEKLHKLLQPDVSLGLQDLLQKTIACSSAIPTSKKREGNSLAKSVKPVPEHIAAVIATTSECFSCKRYY